jgi:hypothetical protein
MELLQEGNQQLLGLPEIIAGLIGWNCLQRCAQFAY